MRTWELFPGSKSDGGSVEKEMGRGGGSVGEKSQWRFTAELVATVD